ncbi:hypothetical protein GCM10023195_00140 [Actinoallomurus liliacearum]|uniref:Uncharacterized protein n=1 Tax=Actinoallomurus liliacearum TaxID=1080073 RepID=A0ABP8T8B7_9ACTN
MTKHRLMDDEAKARGMSAAACYPESDTAQDEFHRRAQAGIGSFHMDYLAPLIPERSIRVNSITHTLGATA